jgi:hypothetical protein
VFFVFKTHLLYLLRRWVSLLVDVFGKSTSWKLTISPSIKTSLYFVLFLGVSIMECVGHHRSGPLMRQPDYIVLLGFYWTIAILFSHARLSVTPVSVAKLQSADGVILNSGFGGHIYAMISGPNWHIFQYLTTIWSMSQKICSFLSHASLFLWQHIISSSCCSSTYSE